MPWRRRRVDETLVAPPPPPPPGEPVPPPREWWPWLLALLILVLGGLLAGWLLTRDDDEEDGATTVVVTQATTSENVLVARVVGKQADEAEAMLRDQGLQPVTDRVPSDEPEGLVVAQDPAGGEQAKSGSDVRLNVSGGRKRVAVPDVVGQSADDASAAIEQAGLQPATAEVPSSEPKGTVVAQDPAAGAQASPGARVRLNVSSGRAATTTTATTTATTTTTQSPPPPAPPTPPPATPVTVPNLVGQNRSAAAEQIRSLGLKVTIRYVPAEDAVGTVVSQSPAAGTQRKPGEGVLINLSFGPDGKASAKPVPNVLGQDEASAKSALQAAGFVAEVLHVRVSRASQNGVVIDEQPGGGQQAPAGSTVTITVGSQTG